MVLVKQTLFGAVGYNEPAAFASDGPQREQTFIEQGGPRECPTVWDDVTDE